MWPHDPQVVVSVRARPHLSHRQRKFVDPPVRREGRHMSTRAAAMVCLLVLLVAGVVPEPSARGMPFQAEAGRACRNPDRVMPRRHFPRDRTQQARSQMYYIPSSPFNRKQ